MTKEALTLALEALKQIDAAMPFPVAKLAIKKAEEALAQPEQEPESNAYDDQRNSMEQAFRKPEQEPVARIVKQGATVKLEWVNADSAHNAKVGNLYTTPPQRTWVGLTDEEVNELVEHTECEDYYGLVEATEAKLKEKNSA